MRSPAPAPYTVRKGLSRLVYGSRNSGNRHLNFRQAGTSRAGTLARKIGKNIGNRPVREYYQPRESGHMGFFSRGGIEPPPKAYRGLGLAPGAKRVLLGSSQEVDAVCRTEGIGPNEFQRASGSQTRGCYSPKTNTVYEIDASKVPESYWRELDDHEASGHSWGLIHPDHGHGWITADGRPAEQVSPEDALATARMYQSLREAQQRNVFAKPAETGAAQNLFKGR